MSDGELSRLEVLRDLDRKRLTTEAAAQLLGLERRQVFRLLKAYRAEGATGLISKRRGPPQQPAQARGAAASSAGTDSRAVLGFWPDFGWRRSYRRKPREIVDQGTLDHLAGKCTGLRIDKFALILLGKQHWAQLAALVIEELGGDTRALPPDDLDALSTLTVLPILVKIAAPAVRRAHLDQPALADREHRVDRGLHRIADVGRLVFDDQLGRRKAPHRVGIARQRDDARAVRQGAARFIVFLELLDRLELFEESDDLGKQFARLPKAR